MIAEVELKYMSSRVDYLKTRIKFLAGQLNQAERDEGDTNREHNRLRKLASKEIVNRSEVESDELKVLESRLARIKAEKELKDSREKLRETELQIRQANYYAPVDGVVTDLAVNPKQLLGAFAASKGQKLARIDQTGKYIVRCLALDTHVTYLKPELAARVVLEGGRETFAGKILQIVRSEVLNDEGLNLFEVSITFDRPGQILNRDLLARVEIPAGFSERGPTIPWNAVEINSKGSFVHVAESSLGWVERQVSLGVRGPHQVVVRSGLKVGEVVQAALW